MEKDYEILLQKLNVKTLKQFIKTYMNHVKITISGKKKDTLIKHILNHTSLINNAIFLKQHEFNINEFDNKKVKTKNKKVKTNNDNISINKIDISKNDNNIFNHIYPYNNYYEMMNFKFPYQYIYIIN